MIDKYGVALKSAVKCICVVQILDSYLSGMFKTSLYLFGDYFFFFFFKIHTYFSDTLGCGGTQKKMQ